MRKVAMKILATIVVFCVSLSFPQNFLDGTMMNPDQPKRDAIALTPIVSDKVVGEDYQLGPGDFLGITIEEYWLSVQVSLDGYIHLEKVDPINVKGLSLGEVKTRIKEKLAKHYNPDQIQVSLLQRKSMKLQLMGAFKSQGLFNFQEGFHANFIRVLSGYKETADIPNTLIIRANGDTLIYDPSEANYTGDLSKNPKIQFGDIIYATHVDYSKPLVYLKINNAYLPVPKREGWTIKRYLFAFTDNNNALGLKSYNIKRNDEIISISISEYDEFVLEEGDYLDLEIGEEMILVGGVINQAGKYGYKKSYRPIEYVAQAGLSLMSQDPQELKVLRKNGQWEWVDPIEGKVFPGDFIQVEKKEIEQAKDYAAITAVLLNVIMSSLVVYLTAQSL